jgi:hypothetical protein
MQELQRWMNNIMITFRAVELPEKVIYKSEAIRHEKLKAYLDNLVEIRGIGKVYWVNAFFNVHGTEGGETLSEISAIDAQSRHKRSINSNMLHGIEMAANINLNSRTDSSRFSKIIDDLGNENYD